MARVAHEYTARLAPLPGFSAVLAAAAALWQSEEGAPTPCVSGGNAVGLWVLLRHGCLDQPQAISAEPAKGVPCPKT
jgi:hypothetical protein